MRSDAVSLSWNVSIAVRETVVRLEWKRSQHQLCLAIISLPQEMEQSGQRSVK